MSRLYESQTEETTEESESPLASVTKEEEGTEGDTKGTFLNRFGTPFIRGFTP